MDLRYPFVIVGALLLVLLYFIFVRKKRHKYSSGSKIANTFFLKDTDYYKKRLRNYKLFRRLLLSIFVVAIFAATVLIARPYETTTTVEEKYNRDIILCMDTSSSVDALNLELVNSLSDIVDKLQGERFGISIFNTSSVTLVPLTEDYEYAKTVLDNIKKSIEYYGTTGSSYSDINEYLYMVRYIQSGTIEGATTRGSSLIGDGLASCVLNFPDIDSKERTRIIIFSTDNYLAGKPLLTTIQAGAVAKKKGVKVFGISPSIASDKNLAEFKQAVGITGGKLYVHSSGTTDSIVKDIEQTSKTALEASSETKERDVPLIPFLIILLGISAIIILSRKVAK